MVGPIRWNILSCNRACCRVQARLDDIQSQPLLREHGRRCRESDWFVSPCARKRFRIAGDGGAREVVHDLDKASLDRATHTLDTDRNNRQPTLLAKAIRNAHTNFVGNLRPIRIIARRAIRAVLSKASATLKGFSGLMSVWK